MPLEEAYSQTEIKYLLLISHNISIPLSTMSFFVRLCVTKFPFQVTYTSHHILGYFS